MSKFGYLTNPFFFFFGKGAKRNQNFTYLEDIEIFIFASTFNAVFLQWLCWDFKYSSV